MKKLKLFFDTYKLWLFLVALFGTNGTQAYLNSGNIETKSEPVITQEVAKTKDQIVVICKQDNTVIEHEKEHHGRR